IDWFSAGKLVESFAQFLAPGLIGFFAAGETNNAVLGRHLLFFDQMVERRNQFARGEVAAGPEDDNRAGLDRFAALAERLGARFLVAAAIMRRTRSVVLIHEGNNGAELGQFQLATGADKIRMKNDEARKKFEMSRIAIVSGGMLSEEAHATLAMDGCEANHYIPLPA